MTTPKLEQITDEDALARQTAQAKLLREARDELAERTATMDKRSLIALGLSERRAEEIKSGDAFKSEDLAEILGVSLPALRNWMAPADNKVHREMPKTAKLLLARILTEAKPAATKRARVEDEEDPQNHRTAFLLRAEQAILFATYAGPGKFTKELAAAARGVAQTWASLATKLERRGQKRG